MVNLRILREKKGLTQNKLCEVIKEYGLHMSRTTYSKYETGTNEMPYDVLIFFSRFFDTTIDYILGITEIENK
ncbi:MAG: helix-turn-helix transcriptional regulator [Clostridia bacterium]|nr:helix-turn-helix transcriptional regulator [Clostridia bacterium]